MADFILGAPAGTASGPTLEANNEYLFAQSFVAPDYFTIDHLILTFSTWQGTFTGQIETKFYNVDGSYRPIGAALISRSQSFSLIGTAAPTLHNMTVNISSGLGFTSGVGYIFTFKVIVAASPNNTFWPFVQNTAGEPAPAEMLQSHDDGATWTDQIWIPGLGIFILADMAFQVWGTIVPADYRSPLPAYPATRPDDYNPDAIWTPSEEPYTLPEWEDPGFNNYQAAGGGRWGQQLVVTGKGLVYYEQRE